jgi:hypothetical protein
MGASTGQQASDCFSNGPAVSLTMQVPQDPERLNNLSQLYGQIIWRFLERM